jgi:hypothetical protein
MPTTILLNGQSATLDADPAKIEGESMKYKQILALGLLVVVLAACQSTQVLQQEDGLTAAGFSVRIADTAERQAMMNRLPANQFVQRVNGNSVHYVYADPMVCGCLYIGTQQEFDRYVVNQQLDFEQAQRIAFLNYYDAAWNWDAWGPWGPLGPIYGPGW